MTAVMDRRSNQTETPALATAMPTTEAFITVGASPRNSDTDAEGLRFYTWLDQKLPSVTTIRQMAGVAPKLHSWILGETIKYAVGHAIDHAARLHVASDLVKHKDISDAIRGELHVAATERRDEAGRLGTAVHEAAAKGLTLEEASDEVRPRLGQYFDWLRVSGAQVLAVEFQVWNLTVGYAGTADLLCRLQDGSIWLVDLKTGKELADHALQLIAYLMAEFSGNDGVRDDQITAWLHEAQGMAVLHLSDTSWEFAQLRADSWCWDAFRGLHAYATWAFAHENAPDVTVSRRKGKALSPADTADAA